MAFVIYNKETTVILSIRKKGSTARTDSYKSLSAAKAALSRAVRNGVIDDRSEYDVAEGAHFRDNIEQQVERINLMSGEKFMESINTPSYCSPASEAYWSM